MCMYVSTQMVGVGTLFFGYGFGANTVFAKHPTDTTTALA